MDSSSYHLMEQNVHCIDIQWGSSQKSKWRQTNTELYLAKEWYGIVEFNVPLDTV